MTPDDFVSRLNKVKPRGAGKWLACCPAHDDKDPSLSIAASPDGNILLSCWAGCSAAEVVSSMGLTLGDLFAKPLDYEPPMGFARKERKQRERETADLDHERLIVALAESDRRAGKRQSSEDRQRELLAVRRLITAGVEYEPDIMLMLAQEYTQGAKREVV